VTRTETAEGVRQDKPSANGFVWIHPSRTPAASPSHPRPSFDTINLSGVDHVAAFAAVVAFVKSMVSCLKSTMSPRPVAAHPATNPATTKE